MDAEERRVRKFVFDHFLHEGSAPCVEEISRSLGLGLPATAAALERLDAGHQLKLLDGTQRILMAFPFSALATPYRVTVRSGRRYFANCAWDAIAFRAMLDEPVRIDSFCAHCADPIIVHLGEAPATDPTPPPLVRLCLPAADWWKDITRTCANTMIFLAGGSHVPDPTWLAHPSDHGLLTVDQVLEMSRTIYTGKMGYDYERPPANVIQRTFAALGLTGPYWAL